MDQGQLPLLRVRRQTLCWIWLIWVCIWVLDRRRPSRKDGRAAETVWLSPAFHTAQVSFLLLAVISHEILNLRAGYFLLMWTHLRLRAWLSVSPTGTTSTWGTTCVAGKEAQGAWGTSWLSHKVLKVQASLQRSGAKLRRHCHMKIEGLMTKTEDNSREC